MLALLKKIFAWYLNASLHVALATSALVQITFYFSNIPFDLLITVFIFCGTSASYNIIKYLPYVATHRQYKSSLKGIVLLTLVFLIVCTVLFCYLNFKTQLATILFAVLSIMYVIPFSKSLPNLRNLAGIKIYIVSVCWAGVTLLLPVLNANMQLDIDIAYKFMQRFVLTLILILIFEIRDIKNDESQLKTVPQLIGIKNTKRAIYCLLPIFYGLEFLKEGFYQNQYYINLLLCILIAIATKYVHANRSKYYTYFWVESLPIVWYALILMCSKF